MKNNIWKKGLSLVLALVLVLSMVPVSALAAEGDTMTLPKGTAAEQVANDGLTWVAGKENRICDYALEHTHSASCYRRDCGHENGHSVDEGCYGVDWVVCNHTNPADHAETKLGSEMDLNNLLQTEAYQQQLSALREEAKTTAGYQSAYNNAYNSTWQGAYDAAYAALRYAFWMSAEQKKNSATATANTTADTAGKAAQTKYITDYANDKVADVVFCAVYDENDLICNHVCEPDNYSSDCYTKICLFNYEHTHKDAECYTVEWTQVIDANNNEIADTEDTYYTVSFDVNGGVGTYENQSVLTGMTAGAVADPTREHYTFAGWLPAMSTAIGKDTTFVAQWVPVEYTITWLNEDGSVYETTKVAYGQMPTVKDPVKADTAEWHYTFTGWSPAVTTVTGNATYTATYSSVKQSYTVIWKDEDGTVLETDENVTYGETPTFDGEQPTKADDAGHTYTFAGWTPVVSTVTGNVTYTATYSDKALYDITFILGNGQADITDKVEEDEAVTAPASPNREGYRFMGWFADAACTVPYVFGTVSADTTVYAGWTQEFTVSFNGNGITNPEAQKILINETAAAPAVSRDGYVFLGWYENGAASAFDFATPITGNVTLTAKWGVDTDRDGYEDGTAQDPFWTVTYTYGQGAENYKVFTNQLDGCTTPAVEAPTRAGYHFTGWDSTVADTVTGNATYNATWVPDVNGNKVDDRKETVTVVVSGNGAATVNGGASYVYDSVNGETVTILAKPVVNSGVSSSFVSSIQVGQAQVGFTYQADYSVSYALVMASNGGSQTVTVTFAPAEFTLDADGVMTFYPGIETPDYEKLYNAVIDAPVYSAEHVKSVKYLARKAGTQQIDLTELGTALKDIGGLTGTLLQSAFDALTDDGKYTLELEDLWLDVGTQIPEVNINQIAAAEVEEIKAMIEAGELGDALTAVKDLASVLVKESYYAGAHDFGYNPEQAEFVTETLWVVYEDEAKHIEDKTVVIKLTDDRANCTITGSNVQFEYKDYTEESLMDAIGAVLTDADGNPIDGLVYKVENTVNRPVGEYTVTLKFDGNASYKPAEAVVTLTVVQAPASMDVPNINITYGESYNGTPVVTNKYNEAISIDTIRILVGLDVAELDLNGDGLTGLAGKVQLLVPEDLQSILNLVGMENGATVTLSELVKFLNDNAETLESFGLTQEIVDALNKTLEALSQVTETGDLEITLGGSYPTNIGVYLQAAVTADPNYKTALDVGYIIIKPQAEKVYLRFNHEDKNNIFSWELLQHIDLNASAYTDEAFTDKNEAATALVKSLFFGIDEEGNVVTTLDSSKLGNGAYTQISFIAEFGNEFYYAEPIARAFLIVPNIANVELVDKDGNAQDSYTFPFDNTGKELFVTVDGTAVDYDVTYVGIQTNTESYNSTEAPKHAGAYTAVVIYVAYNDAGEIIGVGADMAALLIEPADSSITVTGGTIPHDGEAHKPAVDASSAVEGLRPDHTLLSGNVKINGSINTIGLEAIEGNVNVDFPKWLDQLLADKFPNAFANGITAGELADKLQAYSQTLVELGVSTELIADVTAVLEKIPETVTVTFADDVAYTEPGAYFFYGIVTDSDHMPSADTGLLVIQKQDLDFALEDTTVTWDGEDHFVQITNPQGSDYVSIIIDRENNVGNIVLEDELNALVAILEDALGRELPQSVDVGELMNAINTALDRLETIEELPVYAENVLTAIREKLATLPQSGIITLNGANPSEVGTYEIYAITFSAEYATVVSGAVLDIVPITVEVTVDDAEKTYGDEDPLFSYTVKYYDHLGNELTGVVTELAVEFTRDPGNNAGMYTVYADVAADDAHYTIGSVNNGVLTVKPAEITVTVGDAQKFFGDEDPAFSWSAEGYTGELDISYTRAEGANAGTYAINAQAVAADPNYKVVAVVPGTLTILPAQVTVTVHDHTIVVEAAEPALTYSVEFINGKVSEEALGIKVSREPGNIHGQYAITAAYNSSDNYVVTVIDGTLTITVGDYVCWNVQTQTYYTKVSEGLDAAAAGQEVEVLKDTADYLVLVTPGVTLDLNGYTLEAGYAIGLNGSHVVDNSKANTGLLKVVKESIALDTDNEQLPLYDEDLGGYIFSVYAFNQQLTYDAATDTAKFVFVAYIESSLYTKYLGNGATDNDAAVAVRGTWNIATGSVTENFIYTDAMVSDVVNSGYQLMYTFKITGYSQYLQYGDVTFTATIQSGTRAVAAGTTTVISGN